MQVLKECGMKPVVPDGGYFILADYSQLGLSNHPLLVVCLIRFSSIADERFQSDAEDMKDFKFVRYLTREKVSETRFFKFSKDSLLFLQAISHDSCHWFLYSQSSTFS